MGAVITTLVGLLGGLGLSVGLWYTTYHLIVPKIRISEKVVKRKRFNNMPTYIVGVLNAGRGRGIIDLEIFASIKYVGLQLYPDSHPSAAYILQIPVNLPRIVRLDSTENPYRLIQLNLVEAISMAHGGVASLLDSYEMAADSEDIIEKLLRLGIDAYLKIDILCYDEWSGARKHYGSVHYNSSDIVLGQFRRLGSSLAAIETNDDEDSM
ncbi:MAG: hypothetical protein LC808_05910 [Actinobacteria bacterium]|nr:hypothetical protein [Acidobacteriota bacterium]MCA1702815.1 hypothetical protein [Actinomycetota bacterium]